MAAIPDGGRVAGAFGQVLADVLHKHLEESEGTRAAQGVRARTDQAEAWEAELRDVLAPVMEIIGPHIAGTPAGDEILSWVTKPTHQVQLIAVVLAIIPLVMEVINAAIAPLVQNVSNIAWTADPSKGMDPAVAAAAVIRGWIDQGEGGRIANSHGLGVAAFDIMCKTGMLPPAPGEVIQGWNRGLIGEGDVQRAIIESDIGSQWAPFFMQLRYDVMDPSLAVEATVQSHLSAAEGQAAYARAGKEPGDFNIAYQTAGNPPGPQEMLELLNRGKVSQATVEQALSESRLKNKYIPALLELRHKIPPLRSVTSFVTKGAMTHAEGIAALVADGYSAELAAKIIAAASASKVAAAHQLAEAQIIALYEAKMITRSVATADLAKLNYSAGESSLLLGLADHKVAVKAQAADVKVVDSAFSAGRITAIQAHADLVAAGLTSAAADALIEDWTKVVKARVRNLTEAQVIQAGKKAILTYAECHQRLRVMGYDEIDADVLLAVAGLQSTTTKASA